MRLCLDSTAVALPWVALLEKHWFKWAFCHGRAELYQQRLCQGHSAAKASSRWLAAAANAALLSDR